MNSPRLRCPECDYDLRAIGERDGAVRCPECGLIVPLDRLAAHLVRRDQRKRAWHREITIALALGLGVFLAAALFDVSISAMLEPRLEFLTSFPGVSVTSLAILFFWVLSFASSIELFARERWTFAIVLALLLILIPQPWGTLLGAGWTSNFVFRGIA